MAAGGAEMRVFGNMDEGGGGGGGGGGREVKDAAGNNEVRAPQWKEKHIKPTCQLFRDCMREILTTACVQVGRQGLGQWAPEGQQESAGGGPLGLLHQTDSASEPPSKQRAGCDSSANNVRAMFSFFLLLRCFFASEPLVFISRSTATDTWIQPEPKCRLSRYPSGLHH